jgi:hypothetical protein
MDFDPGELDTLSREDLILRARARGIERPEQMTRVELRDEIVRRSEPDLERQRRSRGWLGVARDLLASVVESGLNLPDAAAAIRGDSKSEHDFQGPPPVATVTLAEIYATQGHYEQALRMLDEVIEREPEHATARAVRDRIAQERDLGPGRRRKVVETKAEPIVTPQPPPVVENTPDRSPAEVAAPPPVPEEKTAPEAAAAPAPETAAAPAPETAATPAPEAAPAPEVAPAPVPEAASAPAPEAAPAPQAEAAPNVEAAPAVEESAAAEQETHEAAIPEAAPPDAGLVVLRTHDRAFVYWRVPAVSESLRLRSIAVRPTLEGAVIDEQDYAPPLPVGGVWLPRVTPGTEVRAALGDVTPDGFSPLAVARVIATDDALGFEALGIEVDSELEAAARAAALL